MSEQECASKLGANSAAHDSVMRSNQCACEQILAYHFNRHWQQLRKHCHGVGDVDNLQTCTKLVVQLSSMQNVSLLSTVHLIAYLVILYDFGDEVSGIGQICNNRHPDPQCQDIGILPE